MYNIFMKSPIPSMRENKRYLFVRGKNLKENIEKAILDFIGVLGYAEAGLKLIKSDNEKAVIAINREALNKVRAAFAASPEKIQIEKVSGTLKGLKI